MTRHIGGECVGTGNYWNLKNGRVVEIRKEGVLPGGEDSRYYRLPFFILFFLMIGLGGVYVLLLPVLIIGSTIYMAGVRVFGSLYLQIRRSMDFGWRPSEAYLAGKGKEKKEEKKEEKIEAEPGN
ncbi:MAG: hypothetical protein C4529_08985 [Deltaproteobacteria bacterium]|nr:MAG: hypothetical protein C4529_08985 [Deltaproteobacteria bacterium]